jgi:outer membrane protein assembly factor BamB
MAFDNATGKLRWQSAKIEDVAQRLRQMGSYGMFRQPTVALIGNHFITTTIDPNRSTFMSLTCYAADSGRIEWTTANDGYIFTGGFIADGETIYATGGDAGTQRAVSARDERQQRHAAVGAAAGHAHAKPARRLVLRHRAAARHSGRRHRGADQRRHAGDGRPDGAPHQMVVRLRRRPADCEFPRRGVQHGRGLDVAIDRGLVFMKDRMASDIYALDVEEASLRWKRAMNSGDVIVGFDDGNIYLKGDGLFVLSARSFTPVWSSTHFGDNAVSPQITGSRVYVSGSRGLFEIDKVDGQGRVDADRV